MRNSQTCSHTHSIGRNQCDQIGLFLKGLGVKLSIKSKFKYLTSFLAFVKNITF